MAIIKDKYTKKGAQIRSKYETRKDNRAIQFTPPSGLSTQQKQQISTQNYRSNFVNAPQIAQQTVSVSNTGINTGVGSGAESAQAQNYNISHFSFEAANTVGLITKISTGESLKDIIIHNYNTTSAESTISIYWSVGDQDNVAFTVSGGLITVTTGVTYISRLFGADFPYLSTVSLRDILFDNFSNVTKDIYFYGVSQLAGPNITYIKG